ncbi:MAG: hypothetical protein ACYDC2_06925 [Solirubrobacteraceae bacterium]
MPGRTLVCPHCGLTKTVPASEPEDQHCPRCLARSGGALSVFLGEAKPARRSSPRLIAQRLLRLGRTREWARP